MRSSAVAHSPRPAGPLFRLSPLTAAIRALLAGSCLFGGLPRPARAELPVPASALVGAGNVLAPVVNGNAMTIQQLSDKATLNWKSFNIGPQNSVKFEQPSSTSVALNNIRQGDPSRIYGTLTANGQVYLVNQNGFLFGKNAQINVNSLVASTLDISEQTFQLGLARAFSKNNQPALAATDANGQPIKELYLKDPQGRPVLDQAGNKVKVQIFVEQGAKIATNAANGRIILAAPSITNQGTIEAPDGQVILAASQDKVYLQQAGADSDLRGLLVEVGTGGDVNNVGKMIAERGNASLIGFAVNQRGLVSASTSVKLNGSVRLLAREGFKVDADGALLPGATKRSEEQDDGLGRKARVVLGENSLTAVKLDANKAEMAVDAQAQSRSHIEIAAHSVRAQAKSSVWAPSGVVNIAATDDPVNPAVKGDGRVYLDAGSRIDVSGVKNVSLPMARNVVKVELRSNELRDAPLQREGVLHGKTVSVDIRDADAAGHLPIADISGALARIERNIDERSTSGGTINVSASGDLIARPGSVLDVSGGSVFYRPGFIKTTQLIAGGQLYDIGLADPDRHYDGILGDVVRVHSKWGVTERWARSGVGLKRYESGYAEGKAGGSLNLAAYSAMLDGLLKGKTINGRRQRDPESRTPGSTLSIDLNQGNLQGRQDVLFARNGSVSATALGPDDPFPVQPAANGAVGETQPATLKLDPAALRKAGFTKVAVKTNGTLKIDSGARIRLPENGSLSLAAGGFDVQGVVKAPGGTVSLDPIAISVDGKPLPQPSGIVLGKHAQISVRGEWINDIADPRLASAILPKPVAKDGGAVSLTTEQGNLVLEPGSRIDASGGAWLSGKGELHTGKGGSIKLIAQTEESGKPASNLVLDGKLEAWGATHGGSLELASSQVVIGPASAATVGASGADTASLGTIVPLVLSPQFFRQGGFADYSVGADLRGLSVADEVELHPLQRNLNLPGNLVALHSGERLPSNRQPIILPDDLRGPASLRLYVDQAAEQERNEVLSIGRGARIDVDRAGQVTLESDTSIHVDGSISAPAGQIAMTLTKPAAGDHGYYAAQAIWLGADSRLSAKGAYAPERDPTGLKAGEVLPGGTVELTARRGAIVAEAGSKIDVSGTAETLQFRDPAAVPQVSEKLIPSAGGSIRLTAGEGIVADGALLAKSGGGTASGGTLKVELNGSLRGKPAEPIPGGVFPDDKNLDQPRVITVSADAAPALAEGLAFGDNLPSEDYSGQGFLSADRINAGGFGTVSLRTDAVNLEGGYVGAIRFKGEVQLTAGREIALDSPTLAWAPLAKEEAGGASLVAPHVVLGSTQSRVDNLSGSTLLGSTLAPAAKGGAGRFQVSAQGIDLTGGLSFDGYGQVHLASRGDVRAIGIRVARETKNYLGELRLEGDLTLLASQVYPATLTDYTITLTGTDSTLSLQSSGGARDPAYSAGGSFSLNAPNIIQAGVLAAPFGQLNLNASQLLQLSSNSLTTVSGDGLTVPFGRGSGGLNWLYPLDSSGLLNRVIDTPPEKRIALNGPNLRLQPKATVDISGSGDLSAYEFITGPGGSNDVLDPSDAAFTAKFAVIPGVHSIATPYDPLEFPISGLHAGDSVYLSGGSGLKAGSYTLLPAHYALLPGAYLVTPVADSRDPKPGDSYQLLNGATLVAGRYQVANTGISDTRWQGFAVEAGRVARTRSEYHDYSANSFFAQKAATTDTAVPRLPMDAGTLALSAGTALTLGADVYAAAATGGRGGNLDISADRLNIVGERPEVEATGTVSLLASDLNRLGGSSLLLGGLRSQERLGQRLTVTAEQVSVAGDADLSGREIILAARDEVKVEAGASVASTGTVQEAGDDFLVSNRDGGDSDGALLRVSALQQIDVVRDQATPGTAGLLTVETGARLQSEGSILLDSTRDTRFDGRIVMEQGALSLKSSKIGIGAAPEGTTGLVIAADQLNVDDLRLISASSIDLYGTVSFTNQTLTLDTATLNGYGGTGVAATLSADVLRWSNTAATSTVTPEGASSLALNARQIELGDGQYAIQGYAQTAFNASQSLLAGFSEDASSESGAAQADDATATHVSTGQLRVDGDLALNAGQISGADGSTMSIDSGAHGIALNALAAPADPRANTGLGVGWNLAGASIAGAARFDLPSGQLKLDATQGDVNLAGGTAIDLSGQAVSFGSLTRYSAAGSAVFQAAQGHVLLASGAALNLAGAAIPATTTGQTSAAGSLAVLAPQGGFDWSGQITANAAAGSAQGRFSADLGQAVAGGFSALNAKLGAAGFTEQVTLRQRSGDIALPSGETAQAHRFELAADAGAVRIDGRVDASGAEGGMVAVQGSRGVALGAGASIDAHAQTAGAKGGSVSLDAVASGTTDKSSGLLGLAAASTIDVSGGAGGEGGSVHLRTGRDDVTGQIKATAINATITGSGRTVLEAARVYTGVSSIDADAIAGYQADAAAFMAKAAKVNALVDHSGAGILLAPGIDIRNTGDIALDSAWDFAAQSVDPDTGTHSALWRYDGVPGYLSLNAGGALRVNASISDGFATASLPDPLGIILPDIEADLLFLDVVQPGYSWSYSLKAGGDVLLANTYRVPNPEDPENPDNTLSRQVVVRTGTGDIDIQAAGAVRFVANPDDPKAAAAVYTMGRPAEYSWGDLLLGNIPGVAKPGADQDLAAYLRTLDPGVMASLLRFGYFNEYQAAWSFLAEYPTHGGDLHLSAGGDIVGIQTGQVMSDWLVRSGTWNDDSSDTSRTPTAWGINISGSTANEAVDGVDDQGNPAIVNVQGRRSFNQNVGALGGGEVRVEAGGSVSDLSVMIPTTGKPMGVLTTPSNGGKPDLSPSAGLDTQWLENGTVVQGGGDLSVEARGDIRGGEFYTGRGTGRLVAGGGIYAADSGLASIVELGDARFDLAARKDVHLGTALNPTLMPQHEIPDFASGQTASFITYGADSAVNLASAGGNIVLQGGLEAWKDIKGYSLDEEAEFNLALYPGTLRATALQGDIRIDGSINLHPTAVGQLELLAGHRVGTDAVGNNTLAVNLSDADPAAFPSLAAPATQLVSNTAGTLLLNQLLDAGNPDSSLTHATTPVHTGDAVRAAVVARDGDIAVASGGRITFYLAKAAQFQAGRDISNISIIGQNLAATDATEIRAGRDLVFDTHLDTNGNVASLDQRIQVGGPGSLQILAGRDINLGGSSGVLSVGNLANRALPAGQGASIDLLAGLSSQPDVAGFFKQYLKAGSRTLDDPAVFGAVAGSDFSGLPDEEKLARIDSLGDAAKLGIAKKILFSEIKQAAGAAAAAPETQRGALYKRGFDAIQALFPAEDYKGDLGLVFSQVKSYDGGGIDILTPGGQVDVGLAGTVGGVQKSADQLGIVVQAKGEFNAYTQGNFNVNQSRVFTMGGGDIAIWSSKGSIDAGKGAKSAISAPPPTTTIDEKGNIVTVFPPIVSGSGIQAISPSDGSGAQGNVYLAAPGGIVNAGEAGISGGKVVIAASAVIGASNIQASGGTVGVPTAVAPPVIPAGVSGAAAGAAKAATESGGLDQAGKAQDEGEDSEKKKSAKGSSILSTDVVGYGKCSVADVRDGATGCGG
jgi:filamentous hemagglutinin